MPEGPSIVILKELVNELHLEGNEIKEVTGNTKLDKDRLLHQKVVEFKSWGKHFLICFEDFVLRVHFMLFGSYKINEQKETPPRIGLIFKHDELNFYACSLKFIEGDLEKTYDFEADVMADEWNPKKAIKKLADHQEELVCDVLLDQQIFSGVGNIIKNEVLYRIGVSPLNKVGQIPAKKLAEMVSEARNYSFDFLRWKKEYTLKKHWLAHTKKTCPKGHPIIKEYLGKTKRRTFYCTVCQKRY
ncbi:MAG: DNA-formamidopyrimidine glycosylase family protein [Pedobacter sp.]|nr:DNA-formamidopyrimidine glycosylase family protein [Pedobacter sp.]MDQ8053303.1 DNA-formamidopyrimidine glycosylase family protein [Pedobacter sp.]